MPSMATYNRAPVVRGDTLRGWSVAVEIDGQPVGIQSARLHLRARGGRLVYSWPAAIDGAVVRMADVGAAVTAEWPAESLTYDLELTLADGRVATWLQGEQPVLADRTY